MIIVILPLFNILQIVDLGKIIVVINTIRATILTIAIIAIIMAINYREKSIMFVVKKVVTLISI